MVVNLRHIHTLIPTFKKKKKNGGVQRDDKKALRYRRDPPPPSVRSLVDVVGSQYRQTERQRQTNMACVNSSARPAAGSSVPFIGPSSSSALPPTASSSAFILVPSRNHFHSPSCFPFHLLAYTHSHTPKPPKAAPRVQLLSTFSVGWAALPP